MTEERPATAGHSPLPDKPRIVAIDVLRGFALLGIVGANIVLYDIETPGDIEPAFANLPVSALGAPFMIFTLVFVINKMMAVFSMLFGAAILLVSDNATSQTDRRRQIYFRRNLLLLLIGLIHTWLWIGDILAVYGLCGLVLYFFCRLSAKVLIGAGAILWYWAPLVWLLFGLGPHGDEYFSRAFSMMLIGMGLYRLGIINGQKPKAWYRGRGVWSILLGLPFVSLAWLSESHASALNNIGVPAVAFGYVCAVMWLCKTDFLLSLRHRLAAAGQMALTNYLAQTLLGLGFYRLIEYLGQEPNASLLGLGMLAIWSIQLWWSPLWLRHFRYGPLEWTWRTATYGKRFPLLRDDAAG